MKPNETEDNRPAITSTREVDALREIVALARRDVTPGDGPPRGWLACAAGRLPRIAAIAERALGVPVAPDAGGD